MKGIARIAPHAVARWLRYACYAIVLVLVCHFLSSFEFVRVVAGDDSVVGVSGMRSLLLHKYGSEGPERGDAVVFLMADADDRPIKRASRVAGVPGDRVAAGDRFVEVNGEPTVYPAADARRIAGVVPDGMYLLLNDDPFSVFADSRRTGLIPGAVILGRIIAESPL